MMLFLALVFGSVMFATITTGLLWRELRKIEAATGRPAMNVLATACGVHVAYAEAEPVECAGNGGKSRLP